MEFWGVVILLVGAAVIGVARYYLLSPQLAYAGLLVAVAAAAGGFVASEFLGAFSDWGVAWFGLSIFPALIGAIVLAAMVDLVIRLATGEGLPMRKQA